MVDRECEVSSQDPDVRVREDASDLDQVDIQIDFKIPKSLFNFITWYCHFANLEPSRFIYSLIMHSLTELVYKSEWEDYEEVFKNIGVR